MELFLATPRGFCAGVVRAIEIVEKALNKYGAPIYVKHEIVHNNYVVDDLAMKGAITLKDINEAPIGSTVIFSAHGSPPKDYKIAKSKNLQIIDATCPLVTKVHNEAKKYNDKKIILIGHKGHQEVIGTTAQADMYIYDDREDSTLPDYDSDEELVVLSQTTLSVEDTNKIANQIKSKYKNAIIRNDICYAVSNRQKAVIELTGLVDLIIVIGSSNSSNCVRLKEVAESYGTKALLANSPLEIEEYNFHGLLKIGITSGASTPEILVDNFINFLKPLKINIIGTEERDINFTLPLELE